MFSKYKILIKAFFIILAFVVLFIPVPYLSSRGGSEATDVAIQSSQTNVVQADQGQVAIDIDYIVDPTATYQTAGVFTSINLLPSSGAELINNFLYTATVPANTGLNVQFSYDGSTWYNSSGTGDGWDTLSTGTNTIDLSARNWKSVMFYYKMFFTSTDGADTASLDSITLSYNSYSGVYDTYNTTGSFTSTNLLLGQTAVTIDSFAYNIMSLPSNTGATAQFSTDNSTWYNSSGASGGSNTLSVGANTISLSGLNWSGSSFYYKISLTSDGTYTPEIDSITLNFSAPTTFTSTQNGAFNIGTTWGGSCTSSCIAGTDFPGTADIAIIANDHTVTLDSARIVGTLTVNSAGTLDLAGYNLTANPITLTGTLKLKGSETVSSTPTINTGNIVTYDGDTTPVTVKNWSYKTLNINAPGKEFDFTAGATYAITTALNITGTSGNLVQLRSTQEGTQWKLDTTGATTSLSYLDVRDSRSTVTLTEPAGSINKGNNHNWGFSEASAVGPGRQVTATQTPVTPSSVTPIQNIENIANTAINIIAEAPQNIIKQVQQISQQVANLFNSNSQLAINYPPVSESVPQETPEAFKNWDIMTVMPLNKLKIISTGNDIGFFTDKLPKLNQALKDLAINISKVSDLKKLNGVELFAPGLTQTVLTKTEILEINKITSSAGRQITMPEVTPNGEQKILKPEDSQINPFAAVQGVPLAQLSLDVLAKMPSNIIFARASGGLIDFNIGLSVAEEGRVQQKLSVIADKELELVIKPDHPAKKVSGFVTLIKSSATLKQDAQKEKNIGFLSRILGASLISALDNYKENFDDGKSGTALLLQKFDYAEVKAGVFAASITTPMDEGEYQIMTVIEYKDQNIVPKETELTVAVDPEGYVFHQMKEGMLRIKDAKVSVYWFNSDSGKYDLWPAEKFLQKNPVTTNETGKYSFLLPQGTYYLKVDAFRYQSYKGSPFTVKENIGVHEKIELKKISWLPDWLSWQFAVIALLVVVIMLLGVVIVFFIKKRSSL